MSAEQINELREIIEIDVKAGFATRQEIIEAGIDYLLGDWDYDALEDMATKFTDEALKAHRVEQDKWTHETDCDRLDEAFAELDRNGIVARQNFTCCQTCGHAEISYAIEDTEVFRPVRGYAFYHLQDTESAVRNNYLYIAYGSVSGKEAESETIAHEICATLRKAGLEADWNGKVKTRIQLLNIKWQRRRSEIELTD